MTELELKDYFQLRTTRTLNLRDIDLEREKDIDWGVNIFPDGQQQFIYTKTGDRIHVQASLPNPCCLDLLNQILSTVDCASLKINYLYGARCDKDTSAGRRVANVADNRRVANVADIMLRGLRSTSLDVTLLAPHCEVGSINYPFTLEWPIPPKEVLDKADLILYPDVSASRRFSPLLGDKPSATCAKARDSVGTITKHLIPNVDIGAERIIIVDDLCDGGTSFLNIADAMSCSLDLFIVHGVFSNGAPERLLEKYENIWVTNSLPQAVAAHDQFPERIHLIDVWE